MRVYHVVCDRPVAVGQNITLDDTNHTGVHTRVMKLSDKAAHILAHPEEYTGELEYPMMVALRELALEEVRQAHYPQFPSRMACLYASGDVEPAIRWADYFVRLGRPTYAVVELEVHGRCFVGDALNCFDGTPDHAENLRLAARYWKNEPNDENREPIREMLVDGEIRVIRLVKEYNANLPA
ncbi:MAG: DUF2441 domain-containing protein [Clostridia bacterium]|nr:DUF2441 domain-containing protein [Clostridia bacterium]